MKVSGGAVRRHVVKRQEGKCVPPPRCCFFCFCFLVVLLLAVLLLVDAPYSCDRHRRISRARIWFTFEGSPICFRSVCVFFVVFFIFLHFTSVFPRHMLIQVAVYVDYGFFEGSTDKQFVLLFLTDVTPNGVISCLLMFYFYVEAAQIFAGQLSMTRYRRGHQYFKRLSIGSVLASQKLIWIQKQLLSSRIRKDRPLLRMFRKAP